MPDTDTEATPFAAATQALASDKDHLTVAHLLLAVCDTAEADALAQLDRDGTEFDGESGSDLVLFAGLHLLADIADSLHRLADAHAPRLAKFDTADTRL